MKMIFIILTFLVSASTFASEGKIQHSPLAGVYFGGEFSRSLVLGYAATINSKESPYGPFRNGMYADAEFADKGKSLSVGYARTSDVGLGRVGITSLITSAEGLGDQKYMGVTVTMSVMGISFRLGTYRGVDVEPLARSAFSSVAIGVGF
jgi:hypothetical protein